MSDLPAGWRRTTVGGVLRIRYGKALGVEQRLDEGRYPVLGSAGEMFRTNQPLVKAPAIVVGRKGGIGRAHLMLRGGWPSDTTYYAVIPDEFDIIFLLYQLKSLRLERFDSSTATPSLRRQDLERQPLNLPSISEQRRIVDVLEDHLSRLDAALQGIATARRRAQVMRFNGLASLFESLGASTRPLHELVSMTSGGTPRSGTDAYYKGGSIPWVNSGDLKDRAIDRVPRFITEAGLQASSAKWIPAGSVLIAMYGATIGRLGVLEKPMTTNQAIACMTPRPEIDKGYLYWFLLSQRRELVRRGRGGAQPNISQTVLKSWPVPLPNPAQQIAVAGSAQQLASSAQRLEDQMDVLERRGTALRRALLTAAFSGRLTGRSTDTEVVEEIADSQGAA